MEWFNFRIINGSLKFCPILYDIAGVSRKFSWNIPNEYARFVLLKGFTSDSKFIVIVIMFAFERDLLSKRIRVHMKSF